MSKPQIQNNISVVRVDYPPLELEIVSLFQTA